MPDKKGVLWENDDMSLEAAYNPAIPREEGFHIVLLQKPGERYSNTEVVPGIALGKYQVESVPSPWDDPNLYCRMSGVAARACRVIMDLGMADWCNIHCDGNIGAAKGNPKMHIHIFGRLKTGKNWGGPLQLPSGEGPYGNEPLNDKEIERLRKAISKSEWFPSNL